MEATSTSKALGMSRRSKRCQGKARSKAATIQAGWLSSSLNRRATVKARCKLKASISNPSKVEAVLNAIASGAKRARIFDGRDVLNLELALAGATGTVITQ